MKGIKLIHKNVDGICEIISDIFINTNNEPSVLLKNKKQEMTIISIKVLCHELNIYKE